MPFNLKIIGILFLFSLRVHDSPLNIKCAIDSSYPEKSCNINDTCKRVLGILLNWRIQTGILARITWTILVKIPIEMCQSTRIPMTRLNMSIMLQNFSQGIELHAEIHTRTTDTDSLVKSTLIRLYLPIDWRRIIPTRSEPNGIEPRNPTLFKVKEIRNSFHSALGNPMPVRAGGRRGFCPSRQGHDMRTGHKFVEKTTPKTVY